MSILEQTVLWSMSALFFISSGLNIIGPKFVIEEFENWDYPWWLRYAVGLCELIAAITFLLPSVSVYATFFAIPVLCGVLFSLARSRDWLRMMLPVLMMAISVGWLVQNWSALGSA